LKFCEKNFKFFHIDREEIKYFGKKSRKKD